jgi:hypothetical protein
LVGGLVMLILTITIFGSQEVSGGVIFAISPIIALILVSLMAGILYFVKGNEVRFFTLSKINFCSQLIQLAIPPGFSFGFYYGPYLTIGIDGHAVAIKYEMLTANFGFSIGNPIEKLMVLFNLIPLFILIILRWIERNKTASPEFENTFAEGPQQEA